MTDNCKFPTEDVGAPNANSALELAQNR